MYYLHTLKNCNKVRDIAKLYASQNDMVKLDHVTRILYDHRHELFPKSSHNVWLKEESFDCVLSSIYIDPSIPKDKSVPFIVYELSESVGIDDYESLVNIINHPYSVPLSVIVYVIINILLENEEVKGYRRYFYEISRDYLRRNLQIDPFYIIDYTNHLWKPENSTLS